jgi:hypothetical protein
MKKNKSSMLECHSFNYFKLYSAHLILTSTLAFRRRRKETTSTKDGRVPLPADIPKESGVV